MRFLHPSNHPPACNNKARDPKNQSRTFRVSNPALDIRPDSVGDQVRTYTTDAREACIVINATFSVFLV